MTGSDDTTRAELEQLSGQVARLTNRVYELEQLFVAAPPAGTAARPAQPVSSVARPAAQRPPAAPRPVSYARPQRDPINWSEVAERVFTARTLAWAGGVATVLGIVLLFVMASSRGWVTPGMRVGLGCWRRSACWRAAFELDRRKVRADAILAAGGAGIAGLYASLWASIAVYDLIGEPLGLVLAAVIAVLAVALAIRIDQEPLAIFGVVAAMLAPTLVSRGRDRRRRAVQPSSSPAPAFRSTALPLGVAGGVDLVGRGGHDRAAVS